ncbi:unnamed protein product, partial [Rotaria sp. Silwood2]
MDHNFLCKNKNSFRKRKFFAIFGTTSEASHLDGKHVVFGHVISGQSVVDTIQNISVDSNRRPLQDIVIAHCGQLILDS